MVGLEPNIIGRPVATDGKKSYDSVSILVFTTAALAAIDVFLL